MEKVKIIYFSITIAAYDPKVKFGPIGIHMEKVKII